MEVPKDAAIRKRQQIDDYAKKMFMWVAGASVVVGFALVASWFLVQQIVFKDKVVNAKNDTASTLQANNAVASKLTDNVRVLETNTDLNASKANAGERALQVVLDALPADDNKLALGTSIQTKLVGPVANVKLESFNVGDDSVSSTVKSGITGVETIPFVIVLSSPDSNALRDVIRRFEASIRTIQMDSLKMEQSDTKMTLTITAHAYYKPAVVLQLQEKVVKP